jgi:hypothetical protein
MTIHLDEDLVRRARPIAGARGLNRFINEAVEEKLRATERARMAEEMKRGYLAQAAEQAELIADWEVLDVEGWPEE